MKIAVILLFVLSVFSTFAQSNIPTHLQEKISRIEDKDSDCTLEELTKAEAELKPIFAENAQIFAKIARRKAKAFCDGAKYKESLEEGLKAIAILEDIVRETPEKSEELELANAYVDTVDMYTMLYDYQNGTILLQKAFAIFQKHGENEKLGECLHAFAMIYDFEQKFSEAEDCYKKSIEMLSKIPKLSNANLAFAYFGIGSLYEAHGKIVEAKSYQKKAVSFCKKYIKDNKDADDISLVYTNLGAYYYHMKNFKKAEEYALKEISVAEKKENPNILSLYSAYYSINSVYWAMKEYDKALLYLNKAASIVKIHFGEESEYTAQIYDNYYIIYQAKQDYNRAFACLAQAIKIREKLYGEESEMLISNYMLFSRELQKMGEYNKAISYRTKIHKISNKYNRFYSENAEAFMGDANFFKELSPTGKLAGQMNRKEIKEFFEHLYSSYSDEKTVSNFKTVYPKFNGVHNQYELAQAMYILAIINFRKAAGGNASDGECNVWNSIGNIYNSQYDFDSALYCYEKSLEVAKALNSNYFTFIADAYNFIAVTYFYKKDYAKAVENWKEAYKNGLASDKNAALAFGDIKTILNCLLKKESISDSDFIADTLSRAFSIIERYRGDFSHLKEDISEKTLPVYYYGIQFAALNKNPEQAFFFSESMRNRTFLSQVGTSTALKLDGITAKEQKRHKILQNKIEECRAKINAEMKSGKYEESAKTALELSQAEKQLENLDLEISKRIPKYKMLSNPSVVDAKSAQKFCGKNRAILEYAIWNPEYYGNLKDGRPLNSYCIVITDKKTSIVELDSDYDYFGTVEKLRGIVGRDGYENSKSKSQKKIVPLSIELYEKLIEPVLPHIKGKKRLLIVPDGNLSVLPFDILRKDEESKMLCEDFAISLSPSISISSLRQKEKSKDFKALGIGGGWYNTEFSADEHRNFFLLGKSSEEQPDSHWRDLQGTIKELEMLEKNVFGSKRFKKITQEDALEKNLKKLSSKGSLRDYSVFVFSGHGLFNQEDEPNSLLFSEHSGLFSEISSDDGYLTIPEAANLNFNADMIYLSACNTGRITTNIRDGIVGLSRSFMVSGANHIGVTIWEADDKAAVKFMTRMFELVIKKKMDYATAYQKTKAEFRKKYEDKNYDEPFFWALYTLYE